MLDVRRVLAVLVVVLCSAAGSRGFAAEPQRLSLSPEAWVAGGSDGVEVRISREDGPEVRGGGLRIDYDFKGGAGYGTVRTNVRLPFAENFRFGMRVRGHRDPASAKRTLNTFEFKLIDASGDNVWWVNRRRFEGFETEEWKAVALSRRHFSFAWGPSGGQPLPEIAAIEIAITAGGGGKGTLWIDGLTFEPLTPVQTYKGTPHFVYWLDGHDRVVQEWDSSGGDAVGWRTRPWPGGADRQAEHVLVVDFGEVREFGGLVVHWCDEENCGTQSAKISIGARENEWQDVAWVSDGLSKSTVVMCPDTAARYLRIGVWANREKQSGVERIEVLPLEFGENANNVFRLVASRSERGLYPPYFLGEASYWTVVGVPGAHEEALISQFGAVEVGKEKFSIEPFVRSGSKLLTWADAESGARGHRNELYGRNLPIPVSTWRVGDVELRTTAFASGKPDDSRLWIRYEVSNESDKPWNGALELAIRPFGVNPTYQFLNTVAGFAPIVRMEPRADGVDVDGFIIDATPGFEFRASTFTDGDVVPHAASNAPVPKGSHPFDRRGQLTGLMTYPIQLGPGESRAVSLSVPLIPSRSYPSAHVDPGEFDKELERVAEVWTSRLGGCRMAPPAAAEEMWNIVRANLAYILINRDGPAIQPGSRSYERTWIRDGSLTATAMLAFGFDDEVREFLDWFAPFQFESGKVPCCADHRGADPVPEHDSHGQLIYAIAEYTRMTGDRSLAVKHWDRIENAVKYLDFLRAQRMTDEYRNDAGLKGAMFGVLPESISHEGYSAKPMHSYWDSLFGVRGYKDAAYLAEALGKTEEAQAYRAKLEEMRGDLVRSYERSMAIHKIDYLPGCVEMGDFDSTSVTIAFFPVEEAPYLPEGAIERTFEQYWENTATRAASWREPVADPEKAPGGPAYTPYEARAIGALVRLGERDKARELAEFLIADQRPRGWHAFAEVVWRDPKTAKFVGDIPHTWCGSDFINSFRSMFVYEREVDGYADALVLLHGVPRDWMMNGGEEWSLEDWRTEFGRLSVRVRPRGEDGAEMTVDLQGSRPRDGIWVKPPDLELVRDVRAIEGAATLDRGRGVHVTRWPARIEIDWNMAVPEDGK